MGLITASKKCAKILKSNGNIGVKGGNCSIGVGHQLGIGRSLSVIDSRMKDSMGSLCGKMIGSGNGNIGVVWGNSSIGICHQLSISRPLSIINRSSHKEVLSMSVVGINNGSSLSQSLKMILGGSSIVGVKWSNSTIWIGHKLSC